MNSSLFYKFNIVYFNFETYLFEIESFNYETCFLTNFIGCCLSLVCVLTTTCYIEGKSLKNAHENLCGHFRLEDGNPPLVQFSGDSFDV